MDNSVLAAGFVDVYRDPFDDPTVEVDDATLALYMEIAVEVGNAFINRAVARASGGDRIMIAACRRLLERHLAEVLDP